VTGESGATSGGALTDSNDWRIVVHLHQAGTAQRAVAALSAHQVEDQIRHRLGGRVALGSDDAETVYLYTHSQDAAAAAQQAVTDLLAGQPMTADISADRWHPVEEEWEPASVPMPADAAAVQAERARLDAEETSQSMAGGVALYEVRVQLETHRESVALADRLPAEGYTVVRRWRFVVVGANNADQAEEFRAAIEQLAPASAVITVGAVGPTPFTTFELIADSGL